MINSRFRNKNILITGAGSGMGKATALRLAAEGAQLALLGRQQEPLEQVAIEVQAFGTKASVLSCDISSHESLTHSMKKIQNNFGHLDGVFANAGILGEFTPTLNASFTQLDQLISTNLKGTLATIQQAIPMMSTGSIVVNASWTASAVMPGTGAYAATKGALLSLIKVLAIEQGPSNIRINSISPGIILTPMAEEVLDPELSSKLANQSALKRNGTPEDICGTVAWLLSDDAAFVTGQDIIIDGGFTIGGVRL
ncbi:SDR family NAD(P)-dependent oxidoreductase [Sessilibacter sp. MAH4]